MALKTQGMSILVPISILREPGQTIPLLLAPECTFQHELEKRVVDLDLGRNSLSCVPRIPVKLVWAREDRWIAAGADRLQDVVNVDPCCLQFLLHLSVGACLRGDMEIVSTYLLAQLRR